MGFDETLNTAREFWDAACKKTEDVVNIEKLRVDITTLKLKRDKDYKELGKLKFREMNGETVNDYEVKSLFAAITEKTKRINRYRELINLYKNKNTTVNNVDFDSLK